MPKVEVSMDDCDVTIASIKPNSNGAWTAEFKVKTQIEPLELAQIYSMLKGPHGALTVLCVAEHAQLELFTVSEPAQLPEGRQEPKPETSEGSAISFEDLVFTENPEANTSEGENAYAVTLAYNGEVYVGEDNDAQGAMLAMLIEAKLLTFDSSESIMTIIKFLEGAYGKVPGFHVIKWVIEQDQFPKLTKAGRASKAKGKTAEVETEEVVEEVEGEWSDPEDDEPTDGQGSLEGFSPEEIEALAGVDDYFEAPEVPEESGEPAKAKAKSKKKATTKAKSGKTPAKKKAATKGK